MDKRKYDETTKWDGVKRRAADDDLKSIEIKLARLIEGVEAIKEMQDKHDLVIFGDGAKSILTDIIVLKEHKENTEKTFFLVVAAIIGVIIEFINSFFKK